MARMADDPDFGGFVAALWRPLGDPDRARTFPNAYPNRLVEPANKLTAATEAAIDVSRGFGAEKALRDEAERAFRALEADGLLDNALGGELVRTADGHLTATVIVEQRTAQHAAFDADALSQTVHVNFVAHADAGWADNLSPTMSAKYGVTDAVPVGLDSTAPDQF